MAAIPIILAEKAAEAVLAAVAATTVVVGGVAVNEELKRRSQSTADAKDKTVAQTTPQTKAKTKSCEKCPPDCGAMGKSPHKLRPAPAAYQAQITGFPIGMEWDWAGKWFDGFKSAECMLQEAKGNYDQFIEKNGEVKDYFGGFITMRDQAKEQAKVVHSNPPTSLTYYFQTPLAFDHMHKFLRGLGLAVLYVP
jgi:Restriction endonuclease fold toxin 5